MKVRKNRVLGCVNLFPLAALLFASVFGMSAVVTGSISKGGAVTLIVAVFLALSFIAFGLTRGKVGDE